MDKTSISERIRTFYESYLKISQNTFADEIGITQSTISGIMQRKAGTSGKILYAILKRYSVLNAKWLILGEGEMLESGGNTNINQNNGVMLNSSQNIELQGCQEKVQSLEQRIKDLEALVKSKDEIISLLKKA